MFIVIRNILLGSLLIFSVIPVFAQEAAATTPEQAPSWMQFVPFMVIIGVFYFFLIRPQAKKQKETATFLSALKNGDLVITQSGILGRITGLTDVVATLEVATEVHIKVLRSQISMPQSVLQAKKEGK
ncbi:MAG: preprotein translocase subunit YajC [Bdellovibrionota bacterium]